MITPYGPEGCPAHTAYCFFMGHGFRAHQKRSQDMDTYSHPTYGMVHIDWYDKTIRHMGKRYADLSALATAIGMDLDSQAGLAETMTAHEHGLNLF